MSHRAFYLVIWILKMRAFESFLLLLDNGLYVLKLYFTSLIIIWTTWYELMNNNNIFSELHRYANQWSGWRYRIRNNRRWRIEDEHTSHIITYSWWWIHGQWNLYNQYIRPSDMTVFLLVTARDVTKSR